MLILSGDEDGGAPTSEIITFDDLLGKIYGLYNAPEKFRNVLYSNTVISICPKMKAEMVNWFETHLPVQE